MQMVLELDNSYWQLTKKTDTACVALADRHYSRVTIGAKQFTRPGENLVFRTADGSAVWVSWRSKFLRKDGFGYAWECSIFRNESSILSSLLIKEAIERTCEIWGPLPDDGMITYVSPKKVNSINPGYSFKRAGFEKLSHRSSKGLITYHITQERFDQARQTDLLADEIQSGLQMLYAALEDNDSDWYSIIEDNAILLKDFLRKVNELKKIKNFGYQDILFDLDTFFEMYGEMDEELSKLYWSFKWN